MAQRPVSEIAHLGVVKRTLNVNLEIVAELCYPLDMSQTHEVTNQVPSLVNYNLFSSDKVLIESLKRADASWAQSRLGELGAKLGSEEIIQAGFLANENRPTLRTYNRIGRRIDEVEFHPSWHQLFSLSVSHGLHSSPWRDPKPGAQVARAAGLYLAYQNEQGHICPVTMTFGAIGVLQKHSDIFSSWKSQLLSDKYDSRFTPVKNKTGALFGMSMTEKQGGSDVRANTTKAVPLSRNGEYLLTGHKWFCSAPMNDAFLVLAQAPKGLSCFLLPRWTPEGKRNPFLIQRLKDKMGDRSNASSEVEFDQTWAQLVGEEGRGVATIIEMANYTRLDCAIAASALMRQGLTQALYHTHRRMAFGKLLSDQPLMQNVLADLCLESQAATLLSMRLARAYDFQDEKEILFRRIATAIAKYWLTKRSIYFLAEAMEVHGGNGFVEESNLPRLFRQSPVNSIWEGSGNLMCLDVLRAMNKEPASIEALLAEIKIGASQNQDLQKFIGKLESNLRAGAGEENQARVLVEQLALALQASLFIQQGQGESAELFCRARLGEGHCLSFGTLPKSSFFKSMITEAHIS